MASLYFSSPEGPPAKQAEGDLVLTGPRHQLTVAVKRGRLDEFRVIFEGGELDKLREWLMPAPPAPDDGLQEILDDIEAYLDRHSDVEGGGPDHPYRANEPKRLLDRLREARS